MAENPRRRPPTPQPPRRRETDDEEARIEREVDRRFRAAMQRHTDNERFDKLEDSIRHLGDTMITKSEFSTYVAALDAKFAMVVTKQQLGDGDFWLHEGIVQLTPEEQGLMREGLSFFRSFKERKATEHEASKITNRRLLLLAALVSAAAGALSAMGSAWLALHGMLGAGAPRT